MTRRPFHHRLTRSSLLWPIALCAGLVTACSGDDDDDGENSPPPAPTEPPVSFCAKESFLGSDGHPKTWAVKRQILQEVLVYGTGPIDDEWYEQFSTSYFLITWQDNGEGQIAQHEKLCDVELSDIDISLVGHQEMLVSEDTVQSIPEDDWTGSLAMAEAEGEQCATYTLNPPQFSVWGAELDALSGACSSDPDSPSEVDMDNDGKPGVTTEIWVDGDLAAYTYGCQRLIFHQAPSVVYRLEDGGYQMTGAISSVTNDQTQYGVEGSFAWLLEGKDPEVRWSSNDLTYYVMVDLPDGSDCSAVTADLFN